MLRFRLKPIISLLLTIGLKPDPIDKRLTLKHNACSLKLIAYLTVLQKKTWNGSKSFFVIFIKTFRCLLCRSRNRNVRDLRLRKLSCGHLRK